LGLTLNQAKVFLALANSGPATAREISGDSKVARETIYCVLPKLLELGLIQKAVTKPSLFWSIPIKEACSSLLKLKTKEVAELRMKSQVFLENFKKEHVNKKPRDYPIETKFIPCRNTLMREIQKIVEVAQETLCCFGSSEKFSQALFGFSEILSQALERGLKVRIVTKNNENTKLVPDNLQRYHENKQQSLEIRYVFNELPVHLAVADKKQVIINTSTKSKLAESPAIWSSNPCIVSLAQNYFDIIWLTSLKEQQICVDGVQN
jgi:sugar-specific transcriptional regulator TrmB